MPLIINILRPDDLLVLSIELHNLHLSTVNPKRPELLVERPGKPAFLIVYFQPQSIAEKAFFEVDPKNRNSPAFDTNPNNPTPPPLPPGNDPLDAPGNVPGRISDSSRLVFRLPPSKTRIPFQMEALLDWSDLQLVVSPVAAVGDDGKPHPGLVIAPPKPMETALELPYRLIMSPPGDVGWVNAKEPVTHAGRTELWHTRIARMVPVPHQPGKKIPVEPTSRNPVTLRAIWSPDFVDHGLLPSHDLDRVPFLSSMSARDRDQIVILTSGFDGYYAIDPKTGAEIPYLPAPVHATQVFVSALGAWWNWRGDWSPLPYYYLAQDPRLPGSVFREPVIVKRARLNPGSLSPAVRAPNSRRVQALDLSEWVHQSTGGRDQYVRIVYEGYLYPFGHRASLVKVTERKVTGTDEAPGGSPVAYLRQRMYIVVREQEKRYAGAPYASQGREMPLLNRVTLNTRVTPSIDAPAWLPGATASFWVDVDGAGFRFHLSADDLAGAQCNFLAQLIFVSDSETNLAAVFPAYSGENTRRLCPAHGANIAYADPSAGDTILKTTALYFDTQVVNPSPPFPVAPFIPMLDANNAAAVKVPALEELLGTPQSVMIKLYSGYLSHGLDSNAGVFAELAEAPRAVKFPANKSGGLGTPNLGMTALSARKGLVGGGADDAAAGLIDPAAFFNDVDAKLFGTIAIKDLIPIDKITNKANAAQNAPEIRTHVLPNRKQPTSIVTNIKWSPQLQDYSQAPVSVAFNSDGDNSALTLDAKIERHLDGAPPTSHITGKLTAFRVELFKVIAVKIKAITFTSTNGSKTMVTADLVAKKPVVFEGALDFVQTLADILPPGIFGGSGPAIDLTPTALRVSYTLGLPPISIGVFALTHISIMTGLDLPYLDGKPAFEFAFAKRNAPFLLTVECLGGGGFVHLVVDADGVQMVEAALEFGGEFSINLGVASGAVHAMAGIYFQLKANFTEVTGFVDIGGEVSVLGIISISIDLNLSLSYISTPGGSKIQGRATLSISVHVLFFGISVQVSVERSFGSGAGDPKVDQLLTAHDWAIYAAAFA